MEHQAAFEQEIRFALVLYGGVSLAIYINGVTQEFLHLVRATGMDGSGKLLEARGTEAVYRELASILRLEGAGEPDGKLRARFVVDIASGTSAGGINAIFLGKALANGQTLDTLSRLWLDDADLKELLNDRGGGGREFPQHPPLSLLSSRSMYGMLMGALNGMDDGRGTGALQPEMDVFITATDLQGLELPIKLADENVFEKRFKNVFHLSFTEERPGDFSRTMNPALAFAARATSSFPFAFEPMRWTDAERDGGPVPNLERFFPDYVASGGADFTRRAFADGGYLNNKPFSYAIEELPQRITTLPVRRKLVYVEPSPEKPSGNATRGHTPNFLRNTWDAAFTLHQYETIREDLERLLDRNRLIGRVREVTGKVEDDVKQWQQNGKRPARRRGEDYVGRTLAEEIQERGPSYAGYHRLKVRAVTDQLASIIARAEDKREGSPETDALRLQVEQWRRDNYFEEDPDRSESAFLLHFDLAYRRRRVRFLLEKLDEMYVEEENRVDVEKLKRDISTIARKLADVEFAAVHGAQEAQRVRRAPPDGSGRVSRRAPFCARQDAHAIVAAIGAVREEFYKVMFPAAEELEECMNRPGSKVGERLRPYFKYYEDYDQVIFPIFYETGVGEAEEVDVFRISSQDAPSLIDERDPAERRRKLAGTALFHFGAFLDRRWRSNDMLWGRLDAAERIINCLLPRAPECAARLIREAHLAIIREQVTAEERAGRSDEEIYLYLRSSYEVNRELDPAYAMDVLGRSTQIVGKMLDGVSANARDLGRWAVRVGAIFWAVVQVATPGGLGNLAFGHWIKLLYAFEAFLLAGGMLVLSAAVQQLAVKALVLTAGLHLAVMFLGDALRRRHGMIRAAAVLVIAAVLALAGIGVWTLRKWTAGGIQWRGWKVSLLNSR